MFLLRRGMSYADAGKLGGIANRAYSEQLHDDAVRKWYEKTFAV